MHRTQKKPFPSGPRWETPEPAGIVGTYGVLVERWAKRELGLSLGRWQRYVLHNALRYRKGGDLIHRQVLLSTGRQNGKSVIVRAFYGWLLDEGRKLEPFCEWTTILAAAHDTDQARIIYRSVYDDLADIPRLTERERYRADHKKATPPEVTLTLLYGIRARNFLFRTVTSQPGSARGLSAGAIAFDEVLTQKDWDLWQALSPVQSAQRSPIIMMTSTAGDPESVLLRAFYDRLRRIATRDEAPDDQFYGAWWESEDPEAGLDWSQIRQANPALGDGRLSREIIELEYRTAPPSMWKRERLNHWVDVGADSAFNPGVWAACRLPKPLEDAPAPFVLAVDVQPGWERATISVAGVRPDGRVGVEVYRDLTAPITAARIIVEVEAFPDIDSVQEVRYDSISGGAAAFERHAQETGMPWAMYKPHEVVAACMDVTEMILSGRLAHDDPRYDEQIATLVRRPVGQEGGFRFTRKDSTGPIDAVMSMTFAAHGIATAAPMPRIT